MSEPSITSTAPTQNTRAVPTALTTPSAMKNQRPIRARCTPRSRTSAAWPAKRRSSSGVRPNSLTSRAPLTLSVSFIVVFIRALASIWLRVTRRSTLPTRRDGTMNRGRMATAASVRRHSRLSMTARVATTWNPFETMDTKVPVMAC